MEKLNMKKLITTFLFAGFPALAFAAPYAAELSAPCAMSVQDALGNAQQVTEPAGYVANVTIWNGTSTFVPIDSCGQPEALVLQVAGVPAMGTGGVALTLSPAEIAAQNVTSAQAKYDMLIAGGLTITSAGTPAVSGTYGVTPADQANFTPTETAIQAGIVTFPLPWQFADGSPVSIPSAAMFLEIAGSAYKFVSSADHAKAMASAGGTADWPLATVSVP